MAKCILLIAAGIICMGCSLFLHRLEDASHVEFRQWGGASGATVRLYTVHGGGHTIPGGTGYYPAFIVGRTNQDIVIAEEVMHFFSIAR